MTRRKCFWLSIFLLLAVRPVAAQPRPPHGPVAYPQQPAADRPVPYQATPPRTPTLQRRAPQRSIRVPFTLTQQQQAQVDWTLRNWERQSAGIKTFECNFTRFEYDRVFGDGNKPKFVDKGRLWYAKPDKGRFEIFGQRAERWISDGKSIHEYSFQKNQHIQHDLPPEMLGKAISEGPLPFLFGATAESLRRRYFMRLIQPPAGVEGQVWIEAYPATQQGLANFSKSEIILLTDGMKPWAMNLYLPNGNRTAYRFADLKINGGGNLLGNVTGVFKSDPFRASTPRGWQKIVEPAPVARRPAQSGTRSTAMGKRRTLPAR